MTTKTKINTRASDRTDVARGTLFGVAFGDALGKPTEFVTSYEKIVRSGLGVHLPLPEAVVTDDTEMTIAVARAIQDFDDPYVIDVEALRARYVEWRANNVWGRAAGATCLRGAEATAKHPRWSWQACTSPFAKGCGANMRVAAIGLVPEWDADDVANVAQLSAALTHGHPTALAAAELTALAVWYLRTGVTNLERLPHALVERCRSQRGVYRSEFLGRLADRWRSGADRLETRYQPRTARRAMTIGWNECEEQLSRVTRELRRSDQHGDVSRLIGAGWVAEEALATALYAAVRYSYEPRFALQRAAQTSGDSDSLAAIAGSFLGAAYGAEAWPDHWYDRIEYADELTRLAKRWDDAA
jgi:ADP-ribosylglycohydrolase